GGAGLVEDHDPILAQHAVDQGRFANVGPADNGDLGADRGDRQALDGIAFFVQVDGLDVTLDQHRFEHRVDVAPVRGGDADRRAQAQRRKLADNGVRIGPVDLVGDQEGVLVALAQVLGDHLVAGGPAGAGIDQEQHRVRFLDGLQRLPGHQRIDAVLVAGQAAGVHDNEGLTLPDGFAILAITGQPGHVGDYGVTTFGQTVEQRGFADIRPAHQGNDRNHDYSAHLLAPNKNKKAAAPSVGSGRKV